MKEAHKIIHLTIQVVLAVVAEEITELRVLQFGNPSETSSAVFLEEKSTSSGHVVKATIISMTLIPEGAAEGSFLLVYKVWEQACFLQLVLQLELYLYLG